MIEHLIDVCLSCSIYNFLNYSSVFKVWPRSFFPETLKPAAKRKAEAKKETPPAKKAKADGEGENCAELSWSSGFGYNWLKCIDALLLLSQDFHCLSET